MMYDCPESDGSCWLLLVFGLCGASSKKNQIKTFEVRAGGAGGRGGVVIACVVEKTRTRTNRTRCAPNVSKETTVRVKVVWGARRGRQVRMQLLYLRYRYAVTNNTQRLDCCGFGPALLLLLCLLLLVVAFSCWSLACRRCRSSRNFPKVKRSCLRFKFFQERARRGVRVRLRGRQLFSHRSASGSAQGLRLGEVVG